MPRQRVEPDAVFLNIPYDPQFERLYLAYIVGLTILGFVPRATLGIPSGARRLERIFELIQRCRYSIHDLSRVQLDRKAPRTPRFNMPFELGIAVAWAAQNASRHAWFTCEADQYRPLKSISDLNGTDFHIHDGTVEGVMRELCNAFVHTRKRPTVPFMMGVYRRLRRRLPLIQETAGAASLFEARVFDDMCIAVAELSKR
jgi:hypothetical protein